LPRRMMASTVRRGSIRSVGWRRLCSGTDNPRMCSTCPADPGGVPSLPSRLRKARQLHQSSPCTDSVDRRS